MGSGNVWQRFGAVTVFAGETKVRYAVFPSLRTDDLFALVVSLFADAGRTHF